MAVRLKKLNDKSGSKGDLNLIKDKLSSNDKSYMSVKIEEKPFKFILKGK